MRIATLVVICVSLASIFGDLGVSGGFTKKYELEYDAGQWTGALVFKRKGMFTKTTKVPSNYFRQKAKCVIGLFRKNRCAFMSHRRRQ